MFLESLTRKSMANAIADHQPPALALLVASAAHYQEHSTRHDVLHAAELQSENYKNVLHATFRSMWSMPDLYATPSADKSR